MAISPFDPFDLPEWVGTEPVTWRTVGPFSDEPRVEGNLGAGSREQALDLLAVDAAYPRAVCPPGLRHDAHQAWHFGQVLLLDVDGRLAAAVPGTQFDPDLAVESLRRVAKAIGAPSTNFTLLLTL